MKKDFLYTDLADESVSGVKNSAQYDLNTKKISQNITVTSLLIKNEKQAKQLNRDEGRYITVEWSGALTRSSVDKLQKALRDGLRSLASDTIKTNPQILVVGLGNRNIGADCLGALTVDNLIVGDDVGRVKVAAIAPGVYGMTGIESVDIIKGVSRQIGAGMIVAVDTLATSKIARIFKSFQLTDAGITPGSATANSRQKINYKSIGLPVIGLGVPTCVYARSLCYSSIEKFAVKPIEKYAVCESVLGAENLAMILAPKDIGKGAHFCADVISGAINMCFTGRIYK